MLTIDNRIINTSVSSKLPRSFAAAPLRCTDANSARLPLRGRKAGVRVPARGQASFTCNGIGIGICGTLSPRGTETRCSCLANASQRHAANEWLRSASWAAARPRRPGRRLGTAGVGALGLAWATGQADGGGLLPGMGDAFDLRRPHFAPTARRIIYLHMAGSPPHHDLLDPKPALEKWNGKPCPDELLDPENFAFIKGAKTVAVNVKSLSIIDVCVELKT